MNVCRTSDEVVTFLAVYVCNSKSITHSSRYTIMAAGCLLLYCCLSGVPPSQCIIRAMCIHKAPEMIGQNLICCPKHVDTQKNQGTFAHAIKYVIVPTYVVMIEEAFVFSKLHVFFRSTVSLPFCAPPGQRQCQHVL